MISLSNTTTQNIPAGQALTFDTTTLKSGNAECHRANTSSIKMCAKGGIYQVYFSANITGATAGTALQLQFELGGDPIAESLMVSTPAVAGALNNVSKSIIIKNCCCDYDRITVTNVGTTNVTIGENPTFLVKRIA